MQQVPVSNIIMSIKSPKRSIVKNGFFGYFINQFFREIVDRVRSQYGCGGKCVGQECMDDITSHLASCHLSKCSKCSKDNETELILARVRIRGLVGIRN